MPALLVPTLLSALRRAVAGLALAAAAPGAFAFAPQAGDADTIFANEVSPLLQKYCYECHGNGKAKAGLALDDYAGLADILSDRETWMSVRDNVRTHVMPPEGDPQPTQGERDLIDEWLRTELFRVDPDNPDPGRVTIRRLNRAEYTNTIRDLVGVEFDATGDFPVDDSGYGFDTIGDVLSLPPVLMEKYLHAATRILDEALVTEPIESRRERHPASLLTVGFNALGDRGDGWIHLISLEEDDVTLELPVKVPGDYLVRVHAFSTAHGGAVKGQGSYEPLPPPETHVPTQLTIAVNDTDVRRFDVTLDESAPGVYEARVGLAGGVQRIRAVNARVRGREQDLTMLNGRLGVQQPGVLFVKWIEVEGPLPAASRWLPAGALEATGEGHLDDEGGRVMKGNGEVSAEIDVATPGEHLLRVHAYAYRAGDEPARLELRVDGRPVGTVDVEAPGSWTPVGRQRVFSPALLAPRPAVHEVRTVLPAGRHRISAAFVNDFADPENPNPNWRDRDVVVRALEIVNLGEPVPEPPVPAPLRRLLDRHAAVADPEDRARRILGDFATRAWRRPVAEDETARLLELFRLARGHGESFDSGLKLGLTAALVSPHFLFRGELQPEPDNPAKVYPLDDYALASRLSYFLWSAPPDDPLLDLAARGALRDDLDGQIRRMLASPKARALVDNFGGQWLQLRNLPGLQPDRERFPSYDAHLMAAMLRETELFFEHLLREDRSVIDFLEADYTFVNERLARHYGLEGVAGDRFRRISLAGTPRRGVLTHGSVLTLTSNPTRTSPVKRGLWVLENLLNTHPPPPPPDVPTLEQEGAVLTGTLREQMARHSTDPNCASCHVRMDPIGFGLENFDAVGAWREVDGGSPIDPSGKLTTGENFAGAAELARVLATSRREEFVAALADRLLTYALGRGLEYYDRPAIEKIVAGAREDGYAFSRVIREVVHSFPFQYRRGEGHRAFTSQPRKAPLADEPRLAAATAQEGSAP
jgi:mono/diheme cytochrome c family protein